MTTLALSAPARVFIVPQVAIRSISQAQQPPIPTRPEPADEELIAAICLDAEWALEALYQRYSRLAYALAYRILNESTAAEDIVQEVFLSIWRKAASYQKQHGSVHSWMQAIVHHRAIDKVRSAANRDRNWTPLQTDGEQDPPSEQPEVWEEAWSQERGQLIRSVLQQLPAEQRLVIEQAYFGGLTHAEIAERYTMPLGTVKGRMRLGLQKMRRLLEEHGLDNAW
ncbi:MAG TPA: sigma-70 family RNA polymerase sigma factor [Ktedonobacteraceae bacterium]